MTEGRRGRVRRWGAGVLAAGLLAGGGAVGVQSASAAHERAVLQREEAREEFELVRADFETARRSRATALSELERAGAEAVDALELADALLERAAEHSRVLGPLPALEDLRQARAALVAGDAPAAHHSARAGQVLGVTVLEGATAEEIRDATRSVREDTRLLEEGTERLLVEAEVIYGAARDVVRTARDLLAAAAASGEVLERPAGTPGRLWREYREALAELGTARDGTEDLPRRLAAYCRARATVTDAARSVAKARREKKQDRGGAGLASLRPRS